MIDFTITELSQVTVHHVGNPMREEELTLSDQPSEIENESLRAILYQYFLSSFETQVSYSFAPSADDQGSITSMIRSIFNEPSRLLEISQQLAQHLFDATTHPAIKAGEFCVAYFKQINFEDELVDAIGLFKAESHVPFLKMIHEENQIEMGYDEGLMLDKLDKGCIIFNAYQDDGYRSYIVDRVRNGDEALFWKNTFLQVEEIENEYVFTSNLLDMTRSYVNSKMPEEFETEKPDQIDVLNKTMEYFKGNESFETKEFQSRVFPDENVAASFRKFQAECQHELGLPVQDQFEISAPAVKKQSRVYRSVLKLDKNFHVYVHGNRDLIEKGVDYDGRKYYKLYFDQES